MEKIDKKDKKIIFFLMQNSRQSLRQLGKKVGISTELTSYRIKRLKQKKIITDFSIVTNIESLGYTLMQSYYKFTNINPEIKKDIINFFVKNHHTMYASLLEGSHDFQADLFIGNPQEFESFLDEIRERYYQNLSFVTSRIPIRAEFYNYSFLMESPIKKTKCINWIWGQKPYHIDAIDYNILRELSTNARLPTKTIAEHLHSTVSTINHHIQKLEKEDIIVQYCINIDWSKLGYRWFHMQISLRDYNKKNQIINYIRTHPNLIRRFKFLNLNMDLHFTFLLRNMQELRVIIEDISTKFPQAINDYFFYSTFKIFKYRFLIPKPLSIPNPINRNYLS